MLVVRMRVLTYLQTPDSALLVSKEEAAIAMHSQGTEGSFQHSCRQAQGALSQVT